MYCWSCGTELDRPGAACARCGAEPAGGAALPGAWAPRRAPIHLRSCPACGFRGEGIPYFRRAGNLALLAAATLFTYGIGGLVYWLLKREDRVCPSCGLAWERSRPLGSGPPASPDDPDGQLRPSLPRGRSSVSPADTLPRSGAGQRVVGTILTLVALLLVGIGIVEWEMAVLVVGGVLGASGAVTFGWGWKALQRRREAVLQRLQRKVLLLARERGGTLTATDVAAELDLTLNGAERVLLSLDDGFRIRSEVTDEGLLVFEFREILLGNGGGSPRKGTEPRPGAGPSQLRP